MNTLELQSRIDELEMKSQFQEDTIDALNQALVTQQKDILLLKDQIRLLAKQIETAKQQQQGIRDINERPPHY
ncbi:SlyX family protein [Maribrevibacterium harenarium]|uniref:Protein SlyX homolog n=1 Tax=Maribrevibacterium harenarium TaxID=2589817 RepID=A0A501WT08_9GAMM|nr:SlyX family protein [Maribrevibacterium harenarium]TPE52843.1 SlyX family protein [Maribrevibacterium harenarium]